MTPNEEEEYEKPELPHARLERLPQDLEAFRVSGELEDPENSHQADNPQYGQRHGLLTVALVFRELQAERDEIGHNRHYVYGVHDVF
uniref:Uncharacterized protein n=1 Tax=Anguilla anguilla TaxID=7936 RepID=A0A0E9W0Z7_ANGAN